MRVRLWIRRMICLLSVLMMFFLEKTMMVEAAETPKEEIKLTEEFLTGIWVCSEGFVCGYESGEYVDSNGESYSDCEIHNGVVTGSTYREETVSIKIRIIDKDTIQVGEDTAVRAESTSGKDCQAQFTKLLIGKWLSYDEDQEVSLEFTNDNKLIASAEEEDRFTYEVVGGGVKIHSSTNTMEDGYILFPRIIHDDTLKMCNFPRGLQLYREGSNLCTSKLSGKADVIGEWIFISRDEKLISQWKFDSSDIFTIDYFSKEKDAQQTFSVSRVKSSIVIRMGQNKYNLEEFSDYDEMKGYKVSGDLDGILVAKDSEEGKNYIKKAETIYREAKMIQHTQTKKFEDKLYPEVTAISVSLQCMSNVWLEDIISVESRKSSISELPGICGQSYQVVYDTTLQDGKITFSYDESQLPYAYEKDIVIVRLDENTGEKTVLKTSRNLKSNKVVAKITKGGIYYLADSVVIKGGTRDLTKRNPKSTEWARLNDTGDILSLIDLKYIKESNGGFSVSTVSQLASAVYYVNTTPDAITWIYLNKDIDLSGYKWAPMGWVGPNGLRFEFNGLIDGWDYTIRNLHIDVDGDDVGFLGYAPSAGVRNLKINNAFIKGDYNVGIITGNASGCGYFDNCYVKGEVYGICAGSIAGTGIISEFRECSADVKVNGEKFKYLTSEEKQSCKVSIKDYIKITEGKNQTFRRPKVTKYENLAWSVYHNGFQMKDIDAKEYQSIRYLMDKPGYYKIYLTTYMDGQYVRVSNVIKKTVK